MDKIKINNQVVVMRKFVKQAKIRVINKWVKEIKLLQNRKGDEDQVSKCKRKAERLLSGIALLQKMKPDTVSKMALSKAKDWKAVLAQKNVPLEDRCLAVLANYGPVQAEVEKFCSANSYLVPKIATLVQEWEEKAKLSAQSPQKNKKAFQKSIKTFRKSGEETENFLNQSKVSQIEKKSKTGNSQPKGKPHLIVRKPLEKDESEQSEMDSNALDSSSEDDKSMEGNEKFSEKDNLKNIASQKILKISKNTNDKIESNLNSEADLYSDVDESVTQKTNNESVAQKSDDESETPNSDDESETPKSEDESETSKSADESVTQNSEDESVTQNSEDESVTQNSEDEEVVSTSLQKSIEAAKKSVRSQKSELLVESAKNNPKLPKKSSTKSNKNTKEHPTFPKRFSPEPNSTKAVALINLNEMLDMDEIPIDNSRNAVKTVGETGKRKRDTFFLTGNGGDFSEDDNEGSEGGDTNNLQFRKKQRNHFNKKDSYNARFKNESNGFKSRQNLGNSPRGQKFDFREKGFKKGHKDYDSKEQSTNYGKNHGRGENRFNNKRSNKFEKNDRRPGNQLNKNKRWNTFDKNDRMEQKPFKNPSGKTFEKTMTYHKNRNDYSTNKHESFNKSGGKKDELPLHPSWEAKRKLKTPVNAKFQGKRVVFNE